MFKRAGNFNFSYSGNPEDEELKTNERELLIQRQKVVNDMLEHTSIMDTVDSIYNKAKVQSKKKVNQITQDVVDIL